jgi:hypothetical protein
MKVIRFFQQIRFFLREALLIIEVAFKETSNDYSERLFSFQSC